MINVSGTTLTPKANAAVELVTVYHVNSDDRYGVVRSKRDDGQFELFRTISGKGVLTFEGKQPVEVGGDSLIITPCETLERYFCKGKGWTFWWFKFRLIGSLSLELQAALHVDGALSDDVYGNQCMSLLREGTPEASAHASSILSFLLEKWAWRLNCAQVESNPHRESVSRVIEMMHHRLGEGLTVSTMAKVACLSERRFREVFEGVTGFSPKKYYDRLRIETAAQILVTSSKSMAEIADELGYSNQFHFSRAFRTHFGQPPTQYRG